MTAGEAPHPLEVATELAPLAPGRWAVEIDPRYWLFRGPYGGYVSALLLRALLAAVDDPQRLPRTLAVHFVDAPAAGPAEVAAVVERAGRSTTTASLRLEQDGRPMALALGSCARWRDDQPQWSDLTAPAAPPPERCDPVRRTEDMPAFLDELEVRFVSAGPGARNLAWVRPRPPRALDALSLTLVADTWMPAAFARFGRPLVVPTFDLTIHFRAPLPRAGAAAEADDWVLASFVSRVAAGGAWEEDGELLSRDGRLLVQSRQLAMIRDARP